MVIIAGTFQVAPEDREAFLQSRADGMRTSRGEDGCHEYVFAADPIEPGRVVLYERWESKEALAAHLGAMRANRPTPDPDAPRPPRVAVLSSEILQYEVGASGPVGG